MRFVHTRWLPLAVSGLVFWSGAVATAETAKKPNPDLKVGRAIYEQHCARCHGTNGDGAGPDAKRLYPKPRNFTLGTFKFRSTASGTPPTDEDLFNVITHGLPGSGMPAWGGLSDDERWQLVAYVKRFSTTFAERQPELVSLGGDMGFNAARYTEGRKLYEQLQCAACHGKWGRADGPSAPTLTDDWNQPIRAANLTQGWTYRGGDTARDIYLRFTTGIDGTPMPSYADATSDTERWQLAYYVQSLQETPHWEMQLRAARAAGALPTSATDPVWQTAPPIDMGLSRLTYVQGDVFAAMVNAVRMQAVANQEAVVFRLSWDDRTASHSDPPDALVVSFRPDRLEDEPLAPADWYNAPPQTRDFCYWDATLEMAIEGVGAQPPFPVAGAKRVATTLSSAAAYADGRWTLVLRRPLHAELPGAVTFSDRQPTPLSVAVWDGGNNEQGRRGAFSTWIDLVLADEPVHRAHH